MARVIRFAFLIAVVSAPLYARVISYAPYTDRGAIPAVQSRLDRHFVLVEQTGTTQPVPIGIVPPPQGFSYPAAQVVVYDSQGIEEPRVVFPQDGTTVPINNAIAYEDGTSLVILVESVPSSGTEWDFTNDGGRTWTKVAFPPASLFFPNGADTGGPFARARFSPLLVGTHEMPFVMAVASSLYGVTFDGSVRILATAPASPVMTLIGRDATGTRFLVQDTAIRIVDINGGNTVISNSTLPGTLGGWITPDGAAFVEQNIAQGNVVLRYVKDGETQPIAASTGPLLDIPVIPSTVFFAVPTADYGNAWIIQRVPTTPTQLLLYTRSQGLRVQWSDVSAPEVEALIPAPSGTRVLIQVHRPRQTTDNLLFKDPALAVWHVGDPAPAKYDELFLSETLSKGFVHVDADKIETGDPFVFDSGIPSFGGGIIVSPPPPNTAGGGSDVVQEWGVVRASLQQRLVLPGVGHTAGAFGSNWATDVTLQNPSTSPTKVELRFIPNGASLATCFLGAPPAPFCADVTQLTLAPQELRLIPDAIKSLFNVTNDSGALYVTPDIGASVNVNSRTYNTAPNGTYGFTMNGIDVYTAVGPRFPVTFSGAFQGANFRTNLFLTGVTSSISVNASAVTEDGNSAASATPFESFASNIQYNNVDAMAGSSTGALQIQPNRGETIASLFVIDNRTNDPTFFPPDPPASVMRTIPAIGHIDGANGSKFRSDLYLLNTSDQPKTLSFQAKLWSVPEQPAQLSFTLLPHESRVIRDALLTMFNKTGIARLRFTLQGPSTDTSVRVTSRTYTIDANGGTYGFLMPPLNGFQSGSPGDTLEILGARLDPSFRTNLGLVELTAFPNSTIAGRARIDIVDNAGQTIDSFELSVPTAGGIQINDLFHARNLPDNSKPVLIRVTVIQGTIGAYGAFIDDGTNDPAYVAANLAAKN